MVPDPSDTKGDPDKPTSKSPTSKVSERVPRVLLVDDDPMVLNTLVRELNSRNYRVDAVASVARAMGALRSGEYDILVADLRLGDHDGMELLRELPNLAPRTASILISGHATARDYEEAIRLGAARVMSKPFDGEEFAQAVSEACERREGFQGHIHGVSLVDVLQMFHHARKSLTLHVAGGEVHFRQGEIVHVQLGKLRGEAALLEILALPFGAIRTTAMSAIQVTIDRPFQSVLLDALTALDERERYSTATKSKASPELDSGHDEPILSQETKEKIRMGKIDDACKDVVDNVDGAVACGVVDLDTGMLLGIHNQASYTSTLNEVVAAATMDIFRGANVGRIEKMVREHRGVPEDGSHYFEEIQVTSAHNYHFAKTLKGGKAVVMLVTKKNTNIGMGWAQLKASIPKVEPHVP